ncbi:DDT domain-containing protein [Smittium culicis]|uniref:DDT domain-containing protein n=1 Tax=Smittium culicis TaxID=133412 RepID=A0A1R1YP32_9FUNG|nr:DDT domain-containing protein [Smittium culicis]
MPLLNKKQFAKAPPLDFEAEALVGKSEFWKIRFTEEMFSDYEEYLKRLSIYRQPIWENEHTGQTLLSYEDALKQEKDFVHKKSQALHSVYLSISYLVQVFRLANLYAGTSINMINDLYEKLKGKYYPNEIVLVRISNSQNLQKGILLNPIIPPGSISSPKPPQNSKSAKKRSSSSSSSSVTSAKIQSILANEDVSEYSVRIFNESTGKLDPEIVVHKDQITRSMEVFSKKALKSILSISGSRDRSTGIFHIEPYLLLYLGLAPSNLNLVESNRDSQIILNDLIASAKRNFDLIYGSKKKSKSKSLQDIASFNNKENDANSLLLKKDQFPFISLSESPLATAEKKSNSLLNFLREKFVTVKKFPINDIDLIQYNYLTSKKGILYEIDFEWNSLLNKKQLKPKTKSAKKQLKLSTNGTLELVSHNNTSLSSVDPQTVAPALDEQKTLPTHNQWPIPSVLWRVDPKLINSTMETFIFFSWFTKPLMITGFTLDQYESCLGHGLAAKKQIKSHNDHYDDQDDNDNVIPECTLFSSCINALLNVIIDDRSQDSNKSDIFTYRNEHFIEECKDKAFCYKFFDDDIVHEAPMDVTNDPESNDPLTSIKSVSDTNTNGLAALTDDVEMVDINKNATLSDDKDDDSDFSSSELSDVAMSDSSSFSDDDYKYDKPSKKFKKIKKEPPKPPKKPKANRAPKPPSSRVGLRSANPPSSNTKSSSNPRSNNDDSDSSDLSSLSDSDLQTDHDLQSRFLKICGYKFDFSAMSLKKDKSNLFCQLGKSWHKHNSKLANNTWAYSLIGYLVESSIETPELIDILRVLGKCDLSPDFISQSIYKSLSVGQRLHIIGILQSDNASCRKIRSYIDLCSNNSSILRRDFFVLRKDLRQIIQEKKALISESDPSIISSADADPNQAENTNPKQGTDQKLQFSSNYSSRSSAPLVDNEKEIRRLTRQENNLVKSLSELEKNLRKLQVFRLQPIGIDRYNNKYFYTDGIGDGLLNSTSRVFVVPDSLTFNAGYHPTNENNQYHPHSDYSNSLPNFVYRSLIAELGPDWSKKVLNGVCKPKNSGNKLEFLQLPLSQISDHTHHWACYSTVSEIDALMSWLDKRGTQEALLLENLSEFYPKIVNGMRKRRSNLEKEISNFNDFVASVTPLISEESRHKDLSSILTKNYLRMGRDENICSYSSLSMFSEMASHGNYMENFFPGNEGSPDCLKFNLFDKAVSSKFGEIPQKPDMQTEFKSKSSANISTPNSVHHSHLTSNSSTTAIPDITSDKDFDSDFSDSNGQPSKNKQLTVGLRTRSRISVYKTPKFVESYLQYR